MTVLLRRVAIFGFFPEASEEVRYGYGVSGWHETPEAAVAEAKEIASNNYDADDFTSTGENSVKNMQVYRYWDSEYEYDSDTGLYRGYSTKKSCRIILTYNKVYDKGFHPKIRFSFNSAAGTTGIQGIVNYLITESSDPIILNLDASSAEGQVIIGGEEPTYGEDSYLERGPQYINGSPSSDWESFPLYVKEIMSSPIDSYFLK